MDWGQGDMTDMGRTGRRLAVAMIVSGALLVMGAAGASGAGLAHSRVTRGDVTAAFQARTTGGMMNLLGGRTVAAPVRGFQHGRISSFADGTYCDADWHYLAVTLLGQGGRGPAAAFLRTSDVAFEIDGTTVSPLLRTAIKPFVGPDTAGQWGISIGRYLRPGAIADGQHTLATTIDTPNGVESLTVSFELTPDAC
jgi:hypothetical protein